MKIFGTLLSIFLLPSLLMAQFGGKAGMGGSAGTGGGPPVSGVHTFTHVTGASGTCSSHDNSGTTLTCVFGAAPPTGSLVSMKLCTFNNGSTTAPTLTMADANLNSYTVTASSPQGPSAGNGICFEAYILSAPSNATATVTATLSTTTAGFDGFWGDIWTYTGSGPAVLDNTLGQTNGVTVSSACTLPSLTFSGTSDVLDSVVVSGSVGTGAITPWTSNAGGTFDDAYGTGFITNATTSPQAVNFNANAAACSSIAIAFK